MLALAEKYVHLFTGATVVMIPGAIHGLRTADLVVQVQDANQPRHVLTAGSITIDLLTFDVTVSFQQSQAGRVILLG